MIKKALLSLCLGLILGFTLPATVNAVVFSGATRGLGSGSSSSTEDTVEVDPIVTPSTNSATNTCAPVTHAHWHTNRSENTDEQYFRAAVYATAISLESDFLSDIDTSNMVCSNGNGIYIDCSFDKATTSLGTKIYDSRDDTTNTDEWSGTTIYYETLDWVAGNPAGLVWRYGQSDTTDITLLPWINPEEGKGEAIMFEPEDYTKTNVATTKSWTKLEFYWIDPDVYDDGDGSYSLSDFNEIYPDYVSSDGTTDEAGVDPDGDYIFWYGINDIEETNWPVCAEASPSCDTLTVTPNSLSVDDVFSNTDFAVTVTNTDGDDITDDVDFDYAAFKYGTSTSSTPDADGNIFYGPFNGLNGGNDLTGTSDDTINYKNSEPGDKLTVCVSDYNGESYCGTGVCEAEVEFPYCTDLNITDPSSFAFISSGDVDINIDVEAEASTGEPWPYSLDYYSTDSSSSFDGNNPTYTTDDYSIDSYQSSTAASVQVDLDDENGDGEEDDVANACSDYFSYGITPSCEELVITIPTTDTLTCEEITTEDIEIHWESTMSSGAPSTGPWLITSTNPFGTFSLTPGGATVGTGAYTSSVTTLYYTSNTTTGGDILTVTDTNYPECADEITSETCTEEAPVCEDLSLGDPYIVNADGSHTTIDLTDSTDLETLYDTTEVCWDYTLNVTDTSYTGRLVVDGYTDSSMSSASGFFDLSMTSNEMGTSTGWTNLTSLLLGPGYTTYTGTICWRNYEAGNYLDVFIRGERAVCSAEVELPPYSPEAPVCTDLNLTPDSYTMSATDTVTGTIPLSISVSGSDATWTGTLVVERTGSGDLYYSDGSPSTYSDGHLEIPVSGLSTTVNLSFANGEEGDVISSYIQGEESPCSDSLTITKQAEDMVCEDLTLSPDSVTMDLGDEDAGTINGTVVVYGSGSAWTGTLIIERDGAGELYYSDGSSSGYSDGHLSIPVSGSTSTVTFTYRDGEADDEVYAYVQNEEKDCNDRFDIEQPTEVCQDVEFGDDELQVDYNCEDVDTSVCVEGESGHSTRTIEICYEDEDGNDGEWEYNGHTYEGCEEITVSVDAGEQECFDLTFNEVCEDAEIAVYENGQVCEDIPVEEVQMGEFEKFIYTFNFAEEKNSYTDEGVFFSHDEDRAFYTLQYDPTGDEEDITFTDDMWDSELEGSLGDGSDSGGTVSLATTEAELMQSEHNGFYNYSLITNMGFGAEHEENSQEIADDLSDGSLAVHSFIPYIKYSTDTESVAIDACEYDEEDELSTESVCYDPDHTPETTGDVVIENAGTVEEDYGSGATIRIRYVGVIDSGLQCDDENDGCLTEEFENHAEVSVYDNLDSLTADARLVVLCSYLMTQNAGDIYLEVELEAGSDISCIFVDEDTATSSDYRNTDSLVILEDASSSGTSTSSTLSSSYSSSTVSFCDDDSTDNSLIGNLSSYVCEIVAKVASVWSSSTVESTTESHLSIASRNVSTAQLSYDDSYADWPELTAALTNTNNPDSHILYFDGSASSTGKLTLGALDVPAGAWTVVVEDADLEINGNITYQSVSNPADYKNLPSIAFVVLGGDIYIDHSPSHLAGVFYTDQKFDGDERSAVNEQLTIDGSLYGNIQTLIDRAKYVGPPTIDGGGIVIKYDSRILLNTPPTLSEYVDVNTEKGVN